MTCDECRELILTLPWSEIEASPARDHYLGCADCKYLLETAKEGERQLAVSLYSARANVHPAVVADRAVLLGRLRTVERGLLVIPALLLVLILWLGLRGLPDSTVALLSGRRPMPMLPAQTLTLSCLSAEQARELTAPYLRSLGSSVTVGPPSIASVVIRGTSQEIQRAREVISRFETHPNAACRK